MAQGIGKMSEQAITTIDFHGARLEAIGGDRPETTLVAMRTFVEGMGLDWASQFRKLKAHPDLSKAIVIMTTETPLVRERWLPYRRRCWAAGR
jgi:hypothetical protein